MRGPTLAAEVDVVPFPFLVFRRVLEERGRSEFDSLERWDDDVPSTVYVEVRPSRLTVLTRPRLVRGDELEKARLAADLTRRLQDAAALKAGWLMPALFPGGECLVLLIASSGRSETVQAAVQRQRDRPPSLGLWSAPTASGEGLLVDALRAGVARPCPDCGAPVGCRHLLGCDVERCSVCGDQHIACGCDEHDPDRTAWSGEWPGLADCRAHGWFARRATSGWEPCAADAPGAHEDLNRLAFFREFGYDGLYD